MIRRKVSGYWALFCGEPCRDGFKADREHGAIYPAVRLADDSEPVPVEEASIRARFCAYCNAVEPTPAPKVERLYAWPRVQRFAFVLGRYGVRHHVAESLLGRKLDEMEFASWRAGFEMCRGKWNDDDARNWLHVVHAALRQPEGVSETPPRWGMNELRDTLALVVGLSDEPTCSGPCRCAPVPEFGRCANGFPSLALVLSEPDGVSESAPPWGSDARLRLAVLEAVFDVASSRALLAEGRDKDRLSGIARDARRAIRAEKRRGLEGVR